MQGSAIAFSPSLSLSTHPRKLFVRGFNFNPLSVPSSKRQRFSNGSVISHATRRLGPISCSLKQREWVPGPNPGISEPESDVTVVRATTGAWARWRARNRRALQILWCWDRFLGFGTSLISTSVYTTSREILGSMAVSYTNCFKLPSAHSECRIFSSSSGLCKRVAPVYSCLKTSDPTLHLEAKTFVGAYILFQLCRPLNVLVKKIKRSLLLDN